jgi:glycosyltransferase involved in cell wall biosynthesis
VTPFFSVVIPVYNRAALLEIALRSVLSQSDGDFEVVVVDDGSADDPNGVVERLGDPRIHLIRQDNRGGGAARNTGICEASGHFIAFLDSDDIFLAHHLATMRRLLAGTTRTAGYARIIVDRGDGRRILKPSRGLRPGDDMATYLLCDRGFVPTITTVVPAELAKAVLYDANLREAEDTDFAVRLALAGCSFIMAEEPGALWHDHYDPRRQSAGRSTERLARWLDTMKPRIPARAWYGGRGWALAKGVAPRHPLRALGYFLSALAHGCYSPGLAAIVFLQIFLPDRLYRAVADNAIGWLRIGLQPKPPQTAAVPTERPC